MSGRGSGRSRIRRSGPPPAQPPRRGSSASAAMSWRRLAPATTPDRLAYLGLAGVAKDRDEARRRGELVAGYLRSSGIVHLPFRNPPGFLSAEDNARMMRGETPPRSYTKDRRVISMHSASAEDLIAAGILFCGTPDEVYEQIVDFCQYCGGMGNLLMMGHAGYLTHEQTVDNLSLFAREVYPRLKAWKQPDAEEVAALAAAEKIQSSRAASTRPGDLVDAT